MASRSRSRSRDRYRSPTPRSDYSQSPSRGRASPYERRERSASPRRNGRNREDGRSRSRSWSRDSRARSRSRSESPARSTKIVVERLTKNVNEDHLREIFGQYGDIRDLDLPLNRTYGTNRGTAYILYYNEADAEAAIAHMHEAQLDGAAINVSIVLPRRKFSPSPPQAARSAPRGPPPRGPNTQPRERAGYGGGSGGGRGRRSPPPGSSDGRFGARSDTYRPRTASRSRSRSPLPPPGGRGRYRERSRSYSSRSRSRSPPTRGRGGGGAGRGRGGGRRYDDYEARRRSPSRASRDSNERHSRSGSRDWGRR